MPNSQLGNFRVDGPTIKAPSPGTMEGAGFIRGMASVVRARGANFRSLVEDYGLSWDTCQSPDFTISCTTAATMLEDCSRRFNDHMFGLHVGSSQDGDVYGCINTYARVAPTLGDAINVLLEYVPVLHSPGADVEFVTGATVAEFRWRTNQDFEAEEQACFYGQLLIWKFLRSILGNEFSPSAVYMRNKLWRHDAAEMERCFGSRVKGGTVSNSIQFPVNLLNQRLQNANEMLFGLLGSYFAQLSKDASCSFVDRVAGYVRESLVSGNCSVENCAAGLGISARTLHRRLRENDARFSEIVDCQRVEAAKHLLAQAGCDLSELAHRLGYSEQSSFGRAFKRWTGTTPQSYRRAMKRA
ncbi:helix-turn-helix domain-containing protein [Haliea sp. E17]|uniref:AraC family transcriptional regulator n=1 Tax=Haliea sp. E17 TaxID=3401576 RepID=UPI003AAE2CC1